MERRTGDATGGGGMVGVRCVLWHARGATPHADLVQVLEMRGIGWKAWDSELLALAEVCRRVEDGNPSAGANLGHRVVLLLCEPGKLDGVREAMEALERYRPAANVWVFDPDRKDRLAGMRASEVAERYGRAEAPEADEADDESVERSPALGNGPGVIAASMGASVGRGPGPGLRLAGDGPLPPDEGEELGETNLPPAAGRRNVAGMRAVLTDEEVEMLLSSDDATRRERER